ncbi:MAG: AarF/UbiB family protein [Bacteroidetes bacterium]|nr:AarF/UbiB family protein [Bacteroidota bacterium]MDA0864275.1 AarF/UbiB family protein [Bacteroidota bacterium]MDA1210511.1 AarF/UbiB family protein [Bacteroidota bacterium]
MKSIDRIPTSKIQRASKIVSTGLKVGVNYAKYYGQKLVTDEYQAKQALDSANAEDIYDGLKELKGSALKVAQMLSMEKNILPRAYVEKFSLAQFSVPPLSAPLVKKTFRRYFAKNPDEVFDSFSEQSVNAASIGQVHKATLSEKTFAVKIQYPGVAQSISSDLALLKPIAKKMFNIKGEGSNQYFQEVEYKLIEETDYTRELNQSAQMAEDCRHIPNLRFPSYYPELSCDRILTMDWMYGQHLSQWCQKPFTPEQGQKIGQTLWDFYMYQMHVLRRIHADPHPGNFLIDDQDNLMVIDFGCLKEIPEDFYGPYFELAQKENLQNPEYFERQLYALEILKPEDSPREKEFFYSIFHEMLSLFTRPFHSETFDFSNQEFFDEIGALGQKYANDSALKEMNGNRGSKHFIYINRTFFGLYNLMFDLKAKDVEINNFKKYTQGAPAQQAVLV